MLIDAIKLNKNKEQMCERSDCLLKNDELSMHEWQPNLNLHLIAI